MSSSFSMSGSPGSAPIGGRPNSIGLSDRKLVEFVDALDRERRPEDLKTRPFVRWPFARTVAVGMRESKTGPIKAVAMACRSISSGGMSLLHSAYLHEQTPIRVCMKNAHGKIVGLDGTIVSCRHLRGTTHGIGVQFSTDIDINDFIEFALVADSFMMENLDVNQLEGTVVVIDSSEEELGLVQGLLEETPLESQLISSMKEGLEKASKACDLILCDDKLNDGSGSEFIEGLRASGSKVPVLIMTTDQRLVEGQSQCAANAVMPKPITRDTLLRSLAEFLLKYEEGAAHKSTLPEDHPSRQFVPEFLEELTETAGQLEQALKIHNFRACHDLCIKIAESSPAVGYQALGGAAVHTARKLPNVKDVSEAAKMVSMLIEMCRQAQD